MSDDLCPNCITPWKCNGPHMNNEPVGWWMKANDPDLDKDWFCFGRVPTRDEKVSHSAIPLFPHLAELTDEEIDKLLHEEFVKFQATGLISEIEWERWLVKAILRKDGA